MKLISLNAWCGVKYDNLKKFIEANSADTDIFCFQEMRNGKYTNPEEGSSERTNLFNDLQSILPNFNGYFTEMDKGVGMASFIKKK